MSPVFAFSENTQHDLIPEKTKLRTSYPFLGQLLFRNTWKKCVLHELAVLVLEYMYPVEICSLMATQRWSLGKGSSFALFFFFFLFSLKLKSFHFTWDRCTFIWHRRQNECDYNVWWIHLGEKNDQVLHFVNTLIFSID